MLKLQLSCRGQGAAEILLTARRDINLEFWGDILPAMLPVNCSLRNTSDLESPRWSVVPGEPSDDWSCSKEAMSEYMHSRQ